MLSTRQGLFRMKEKTTNKSINVFLLLMISKKMLQLEKNNMFINHQAKFSTKVLYYRFIHVSILKADKITVVYIIEHKS